MDVAKTTGNCRFAHIDKEKSRSPSPSGRGRGNARMIRFNGGKPSDGDPVCDFCGKLFSGTPGELSHYDTACGCRMHIGCYPLHLRGPPVCQICQNDRDATPDADSLLFSQRPINIASLNINLQQETALQGKPVEFSEDVPSAKAVIARNKTFGDMLESHLLHQGPKAKCFKEAYEYASLKTPKFSSFDKAKADKDEKSTMTKRQ